MPTVEQVVSTHEKMCNEARAIIEIKGADYNRQQQNSGDTLFNIRVAALLGVVDTPVKSVLVRLCDKLMRLISLADAEPKVKDESVSDTIRDAINYLVYIQVFRDEAAQQPTVARVKRAQAIVDEHERIKSERHDTALHSDPNSPEEFLWKGTNTI